MKSDGAEGGPPGFRRRGPGGPVGTPWVPYGSVHQLCTNTGQSSDPSSPVGSCRAKSGFRQKLRWALNDRSTVPY